MTIFQNQDIVAEEFSDIKEQRIILSELLVLNLVNQVLRLDLVKDAFRVFRLASDSFTRNAEKNVRYWEQRVGQFQVSTSFTRNKETQESRVSLKMPYCAH